MQNILGTPNNLFQILVPKHSFVLRNKETDLLTKKGAMGQLGEPESAIGVGPEVLAEHLINFWANPKLLPILVQLFWFGACIEEVHFI